MSEMRVVERQVSTTALLLPAVLVAAGFALAGYFIGNGLLEARSASRHVTVKGLAEREVKADLVLWPIAFNVTANDLVTLQKRVDESAAKVRTFLERDFGAGDDIGQSAPRVNDREGQMVMSGKTLDRYMAEAVVTLRTGQVEKVRTAMARSGELIGQGVALMRSYEMETQYLFTGLEAIKPEMIAEATRDARNAAEQFAHDSGSRVGSIRTASQGYFSIEDRDRFSPEFKKVRVVTTVEYFLE